jgi:prepilin-type N-terminal cleavage/methylation domain-containing protein
MPREPRIQGPLRSSGFSIIEAVVVIAVVGILSAAAVPRMMSMSELDGARAHRQALSDLRFAQRRATSSGCPVQVDFEAGGYALTQRTDCRSGAFTRALVDPVTHRTPYSIDLPGGLSITSSVDPLVFDTLGRITTVAGSVTDASITVAGLPLSATGETGLVRVP